MSEKEKDSKFKREWISSEKMKNQALFWGSFGNSILCTFIALMVKGSALGLSFYRGAFFCYSIAFVLLLVSHFQSTKCLEAIIDKDMEKAQRECPLVEKQNNGVFWFICAGTVFSLLGLYFITI